MSLNRALVIAISLLLCCCAGKGDKPVTVVPPAFRSFLEKFPVIDLPLSFPKHLHAGGNKQYNDNSIDTLFIRNNWSFGVFYGMLPDTSSYYGLIFLVPADDLVPVLKTYDRSGKPIGEVALMVNGCGGGGPGIEYCSTYGMINKDLSIFCVDTMRTIGLDSTMTEIEGSASSYCTYKTAKVRPDGKIVEAKPQYSEIK